MVKSRFMANRSSGGVGKSPAGGAECEAAHPGDDQHGSETDPDVGRDVGSGEGDGLSEGVEDVPEGGGVVLDVGDEGGSGAGGGGRSSSVIRRRVMCGAN